MKRLIAGIALAWFSLFASATTLNPVQLLNPAGSSSGQTIVSTGASSAPGWASLAASSLAPVGANTVVANATGSTAAPAAVSIPSCSASGNALQWTSGAGFSCASAATSGRLINVQIFTANGTYTPTAGTNSVVVEGVGGGGGSGGNPAQAAGAGGMSAAGSGGSYARARYTSGFSGATVTVGASGTAGNSTTAGGNGGATSFGSLMSCPGGIGGSIGGTSTSVAGVTGAAAPSACTVTGGTTIASIRGAAGGGGFASVSGGASVSGSGGGSALGLGGPGLGSNGSYNGQAGSGYGGGASGAYSGSSGGATTGGAGTAGIVIVYEYN